MGRAKGMPGGETRKQLDDHLRKRVRIRAKTKEQVKQDTKYDLDTLSQQAAIARTAFQKAEAELALAEEKLLEAMTALKTWQVHPDFHQDGQHLEAQFNVETPVGRSTTTIDPQKYFDLLDQGMLTAEQFFSSVSVRITDARKYLGEKQIERISDAKIPEKKDPVLKTKFVIVDGIPIFGKIDKK